MTARKVMTAAPTRIMKAMDMAKHANLSDVWPTKVTLNSIADLMSHVGRVMLGRPLLFGDTDAMYLDLENEKALRVTLVDLEDAYKPVPVVFPALSKDQAQALQWAINRASANECVLHYSTGTNADGERREKAYRNRIDKAREALRFLKGKA